MRPAGYHAPPPVASQGGTALPEADHVTPRNVTVAIIARNEEAEIARTIGSLSRQTLFAGPHAVTVFVVANGCTDRTVPVARAAIDAHLAGVAKRAEVIDLTEGGKSRTWNRFVHELAPPETDVFLFLDADIELAHDRVCAEMLTVLERDPAAVACASRPTKSLVRKDHKSLVDRVSLLVSEESRADRSICGQLYYLRADVARTIWLPNETPGEDGFLNAMVRTRGFSRPDDPNLIAVADATTHYYDAPDLLGTFQHERRIIVGTAVNCWMFEHLWSLGATASVGPLIDQWNRTDPQWVSKLIGEHTRGKTWVISREILLTRLPNLRGASLTRIAWKAPLGAAATLFNGIASFRANKVLKRSGAAAIW